MSWDERAYIIKHLKLKRDFCVMPFNDDDDTANDLLKTIDEQWNQKFYSVKLLFMNGGDRIKTNVPENSRS